MKNTFLSILAGLLLVGCDKRASVDPTRLNADSLALLASRDSSVIAENSTVPPKLIRALNRIFPMWKWSPVPPNDTVFNNLQMEVRKYDNFICGDFDSDSTLDYAVKVLAGDSLEFEHVLAFISYDDILKIFTLDKYDSNLARAQYLQLFLKGETDYNYGSENYFRYEHDAIGLITYEKAGMTFEYSKGRFRRILTAD